MVMLSCVPDCRCDEMTGLYCELSGVSILNVEHGLVRFRINTVVTTGMEQTAGVRAAVLACAVLASDC